VNQTKIVWERGKSHGDCSEELIFSDSRMKSANLAVKAIPQPGEECVFCIGLGCRKELSYQVRKEIKELAGWFPEPLGECLMTNPQHCK
jgi:hypothetical protein